MNHHFYWVHNNSFLDFFVFTIAKLLIFGHTPTHKNVRGNAVETPLESLHCITILCLYGVENVKAALVQHNSSLTMLKKAWMVGKRETRRYSWSREGETFLGVKFQSQKKTGILETNSIHLNWRTHYLHCDWLDAQNK